ncbi:hypothetical protein SUDANB145_05208 [Streptomyces sp. enrichment culture]|uniref:hypothetical protein n=1 Tax=Streptomyces sp. enrichment culture TaxID=1795815 RepID=UPI003F56D6DC
MIGAQRQKAPATGPFYKQRGWIGSALFLGFFSVMSLVAVVVNPDGAEITTDNRSETLAGLGGPLSPGDPQQTRTGPGGRPQNCRTDDRDTARPAAAPADVTWRQLDAIMLPVSASSGPLHTDATMWWCFAHTPTGAVLAAHIIPVQLSGASWRIVAEQQIVPGRARDGFIADKIAAGSGNPQKNAVGRFAGFAVRSYADTSATVRLLVTDPMGGYMSTTVSLRWRDGDWKVALLKDGSLYSSVRRATADGFIMWGA